MISDIHGYDIDGLKALFNNAGFGNRDYCFVLGDVIDRNSDGVKILQWMMDQPNIELILGNHELMMLNCDFLFKEITYSSISDLSEKEMEAFSLWKTNGGLETIAELKKLPMEEIEYIMEYLGEAPLYDTVSVKNRDYLLTHSGLGNFDPKKKISDYTVEELVWHRPDLNEKYFDGVTTIFGHTPTEYYGSEFAGKPIMSDTWINIDVGAAYGYPPMLLRLDDMREFYAE